MPDAASDMANSYSLWRAYCFAPCAPTVPTQALQELPSESAASCRYPAPLLPRQKSANQAASTPLLQAADGSGAVKVSGQRT